MELQQLHFVSFTNLANWSTYTLLGKGLNYTDAYPFVKIGSFLKRNKTQIKVQDDILYKRPTIKMNNGGILLRDEVLGEEIGTKNQFRINQAQFLLSKIDARNGAFGVVPAELDNGIITGNFWTFDVDTSFINPHYLSILTGTFVFQRLCQSASVGTTNRNYLQEDLFLDFEIPLPSLTEQEEILAEYNAKMQEAERLKVEIDTTYQQIQDKLKERLGLVVEVQAITKNKLLLVNFKDLSRWDTLFLSGGVPDIKSSFKTVRFYDVVKCLNSNYGKSIRTNSVNFPNNDYHYLGMEHIEKETGELIEMPVVKGKMIKSQTLNVPKNFFLFGKLRPYLNKYWINKTDFEDIICSSELLVFDIDRSLVTEDFFKYILSSEIIQTQIADKTSGARMPRINEKVFMNLEFPLPSIDEQKEISKELDKLIADRKVKQVKVTELKEQAIKDFEAKIFKN